MSVQVVFPAVVLVAEGASKRSHAFVKLIHVATEAVKLRERLATDCSIILYPPADFAPHRFWLLLVMHCVQVEEGHGGHTVRHQVWSLTQFYSVDFSQSRISV